MQTFCSRIQRELGRLEQSERWWRRRGRRAMAIQQYDYTACCTGSLQQLPSFWGISTGNRRSFCRSTGRKGQKEGWARRTGGGYSRGPSALAVGPGAHNMFGQEEARVCWKCTEWEEKGRDGGKGPFLSLLLSGLNALQKLERRAVRKMLYYLVLSTVSLREEQNWLSFQVSLEKSARERALDGGHGPPCPFFSIRMALFVARGEALSLQILSTRRIFLDAGGSVSTQKGAFICSLCVKAVIDSNMLERNGRRKCTRQMKLEDYSNFFSSPFGSCAAWAVGSCECRSACVPCCITNGIFNLLFYDIEYFYYVI